jgi:hypothetical protein
MNLYPAGQTTTRPAFVNPSVRQKERLGGHVRRQEAERSAILVYYLAMEKGMKLTMAIGAVALLAGCGGGGDAETTTARKTFVAYPNGPSREFIIPGGDNTVPLMGREATVAERSRASVVIHKWMRARAAKRFADECRYFSRAYIHSLVVEDASRVTNGKVETCPRAIAYFLAKRSVDRRYTLSGPIDSLRVPFSNNQSFAQYHGNDGIDYELPLIKEGRKWRIDALAPIARKR